jgi:4-alpha-glucanotransferase
MSFERASGILLHPTSLPGPYGIGDLGPAAYRFVDFLSDAGQKVWQVLPLGPTGYGDSPYACHSAFAGNTLLISPEFLAEDGLLTDADLAATPSFPADKVDYGWVIPWKRELLQTAFRRFGDGAAPELHEAIGAFMVQPEIAAWLPDFALFMALKEQHGGRVWNTWEAGAARRDPAALAACVGELGEAIEFHVFTQFLFRRQWRDLKAHANAEGISLLGDIPIFVAYDSADVWTNRHLFELEPDGTPLAVAGVPPDYFSESGQLWGNPLYHWPAIAAQGFDWWVERFRCAFELVDSVRLDHFRGFESFWRVPAGEKTAINGKWVEAPGDALFTKLGEVFGELPIVAEDLGIITDEVDALRVKYGFPGMRILQFAFHPGANFYLPHLYPQNTVVYTGTHDNDTAVGWWAGCTERERVKMRAYLGGEPTDIHWSLIRLALGSVADLALFPLQDALGLGGEARMNTPGEARANWAWRVSDEVDWKGIAARLREMVEAYDRLEAPPRR